MAAAVLGDSDIVEHFGEGNALGRGFEGGGGLVEVSEMIFAEAEEEIGLAEGGIAGGKLGEPEGGLLIVVRGKVGFGQQQNGLRIVGIDGDGGLEITDLVGGAAGKNAADEVLKGIQADGGRALQKALARLGERRTHLAQHIPGERGLDADEIVQRAALHLIGREAQGLHVQNLGAGGEGSARRRSSCRE